MHRAATLRQLSRLLLNSAATNSTLAASHSGSLAGRCLDGRLQAIATSASASAAAEHATPKTEANGGGSANVAGSEAAAIAAAAAAASGNAGSTGSQSPGGGGGGRRMGPILLLPAAVAAGLGSWQLARRSEKQLMLDSRLAAMRADPVDVFATSERLPEHTPVVAEGVLDDKSTIFVGPRARSAMGGTIAGKLVVTPLLDPSRGNAVLVVRGWAPAAWEPDRSNSSSAPEQVRLQGVTRDSEPRGGFVPDNVPGSSIADPAAHWYWLESPALARAMGLPPDTPLIEAVADEPTRDEGPSAMEVLGGRTSSLGNAKTSYPHPKTREELLQFPVMPQGHLNYAATWFTLSGCIALAALAAMRRQPPRPSADPLRR